MSGPSAPARGRHACERAARQRSARPAAGDAHVVLHAGVRVDLQFSRVDRRPQPRVELARVLAVAVALWVVDVLDGQVAPEAGLGDFAGVGSAGGVSVREGGGVPARAREVGGRRRGGTHNSPETRPNVMKLCREERRSKGRAVSHASFRRHGRSASARGGAETKGAADGPERHEQVDDGLVVGLGQRADIDRLRVVAQPLGSRASETMGARSALSREGQSGASWCVIASRGLSEQPTAEGGQKHAPVAKVDALDVEPRELGPAADAEEAAAGLRGARGFDRASGRGGQWRC